MTTPRAVIRAQGVGKGFSTPGGRVAVLDGLDLGLDAGESLAITGESGSGKSTLLHLIGGLDVPDRGRIEVLGCDIAGLGDGPRALLRRGGIGIVFQQFNLIPSLRVEQNLAFQARLAGRFDAGRLARLAADLGLAELLSRWPEQLSGGQQQRVAIGRALAARPPLILADEPTGNLDPGAGDVVADLMLSLVRREGAALVLVTHSARLAARCDRHLRLRAGRLVAGAP